MHALTLEVDAVLVDAVCDLLGDDHEALSVSIEDADAGTPAERPVFDEPGGAGSGGWRRARISALFADEAAATAAAAALAASDVGRGTRIEAIAPVDERDWVRLTQAQFGPTELDLQLRRRGITTIVLGGIATNFGVESTARLAWELGYAVVLAEDACAGVSAELHEMAVLHIFPRIARVSQSAAIGFASN